MVNNIQFLFDEVEALTQLYQLNWNLILYNKGWQLKSGCNICSALNSGPIKYECENDDLQNPNPKTLRKNIWKT